MIDSKESAVLLIGAMSGEVPVKIRDGRAFFASDRGRITLITLLALAARVAVVFLVSNFTTVSGFENEEIALNLVSGRGYSFSHFGPVEPTAFMYPVYTFFLAFHFFVFGDSWLPVELSQALLGAVGAPLIIFIGFRLFGRMTGWIAGVIYSLYPFYVYWATQGQALVLESVLLMALLLSWDRGMEAERGLKHAILPGVLFGAAILSKTLYLAFWPALFIWTMTRSRLPRLAALRYCLAALAAALLVAAPWTVRNAVRFHQLILVTDNTGFNLWLGNNPHAAGGLFTPSGRHVSQTISPELEKAVRAAPDSPARDRVFMAAAKDFIRDQPARFLGLVPGRLRALWWFDPHMPSRFGRLRSLAYISLLVLAVFGMVRERKSWKDHGVFYLMFLTITGVYSIFFGQSRFRIVLEWSLMLFAASTLAFMLAAAAKAAGIDIGRADRERGRFT